MGEVVGAGILAHVPTIMLPEQTRLELNEGKDISLVPALHELRKDVFSTLDYDTVVVLDSHWFTTVEFVVTAQDRRAGLFTAEELPRGMCRIPYDWRGDAALAWAMQDAAPAHSTWVTAIDDPYLPIYYATVNLWKYLGEGLDKQWISVSVAQTGEAEDFLRAGRALGDAIARTDRKVLVIASGALSHTFWKLRQLRDHEASDPKHIRTPEAYAADLERIEWFKAGDHAKVLGTMGDFMKYRPEAMFAHYLMLAGAVGEEENVSKARQYGNYENSIGTGQVHLWFDRPEAGFAQPKRTPEDPDFIRQMAGPDLPAAG
jgi:aromatic ring-opening dioxygenase catalytic subunit (LigB family)